MKSVLRSLQKRKCLGRIEIVDRAVYQDLELDTKVELIRGLIPLGLMHIEALLDEKVTALAGSRYQHKDASVPGMRHGYQPRLGALRWSTPRDSGAEGARPARGARAARLWRLKGRGRARRDPAQARALRHLVP